MDVEGPCRTPALFEEIDGTVIAAEQIDQLIAKLTGWRDGTPAVSKPLRSYLGAASSINIPTGMESGSVVFVL